MAFLGGYWHERLIESFIFIFVTGARVILACRNLERCVKAAEEITAETLNHDIVVMKLNLASTPSIEDFARDINQRKIMSQDNYSIFFLWFVLYRFCYAL